MKTKEEKEFEKRVNLYFDDYNKYLIEIIKEVIPRQLVSLYNHNLILKHEKLMQHINSISDVFNLRFNFNDIRKDVEEILKDKYNYIIVKDAPLIMKKIK